MKRLLLTFMLTPDPAEEVWVILVMSKVEAANFANAFQSFSNAGPITKFGNLG